MQTLFRLALPFCLFLTGLYLIRSFFRNGDTVRQEDLQLLLVDGVVTVAELADEHRIVHRRVGWRHTTTYLVRYRFLANGMEWRGLVQLDTIPAYRNAIVTYLPTAPSIHAIDPAAELAEQGKGEETGELIAGLFLTLIGFLGSLFGIRLVLSNSYNN